MFIAFDTTNNSQLLLGAKPHIPLLKELRFITHESSINISLLTERNPVNSAAPQAALDTRSILLQNDFCNRVFGGMRN